jgi:hypothetical protein
MIDCPTLYAHICNIPKRTWFNTFGVLTLGGIGKAKQIGTYFSSLVAEFGSIDVRVWLISGKV